MHMIFAQELHIHVSGRQLRVKQSNGVRQGSPDSPTLFALLNEAVAVGGLREDGEREHFLTTGDFSLDPGPIPAALLLFMDDAWVIALDWPKLQTRVNALVRGLGRVGLALGPAKTQVLSAPAAPPGALKLHGETIRPVPGGTTISALGTGVGFKIPSNTPQREACARARGAFWGQRALFEREGPIDLKMRLFERTVQAKALWNAGVFVPQKQGLQSLSACQIKLIRAMRKPGRHPGEGWVEWELRTLRRARADLHRTHSPRWSTVVLEKVWDLWGHVGRQTGVTREVLAWRNQAWWRRQQAQPGGLRHPGRFSPHIDPERQLQAVIDRHCGVGVNWETIAMDRDRWRALRPEFVQAHDVPWTTGRQLAVEDGEHLQGPRAGDPRGNDPVLLALGGP